MIRIVLMNLLLLLSTQTHALDAYSARGDHYSLLEFVKKVSMLSQTNFLIDANLEGEVSFSLPNPLTGAQWLGLLKNTLNHLGFSLEKFGNTYTIRKYAPSLKKLKQQLYTCQHLTSHALMKKLQSFLDHDPDYHFSIIDAHSLYLSSPKNDPLEILSLLRKLDQTPKNIHLDILILSVSHALLKTQQLPWNTLMQNMLGWLHPGVGVPPLQHWSHWIEWMIKRHFATIIATPSLTLLPGEQGNLNVGKRISIPNQTQRDDLHDALITQYHTENVGLSIQLTPLITGDSQVKLKVIVHDRHWENPTETLPIITTSDIDSTLTLKQNQWEWIGGLNQNSWHQHHAQPRPLNHFPVVKQLFDNHQSQQQDKRWLVFIRARAA